MPRSALFSGLIVLGVLGGWPALASDVAPPLLWPPGTPAFDGQTAQGAAAATAPSLDPTAVAIRDRLASTDAKSGAEREDRTALDKFYEEHQYEPIWFDATGMKSSARAVIAEIGKAADWGLEASAFPLPAFSRDARAPTERAQADVTLSLAVLKYARYARGGRTDPDSLSRYLDRKPPVLDPGVVITQAAKATNPDAYLRSLHPQHPQFELLRQKYLALQRGGSAALDNSSGTAETSAKTKAAPAATSATLRKLLVNMEEWRWMPESLGEFYVWVNIPEYMLRVVSNGNVILSERVVVGKPDTQTPVFSDEMEQVIFHPFWGVPDSIKKNEILPSLARGSTRILERHNLRVQYRGRDIDPESVDWTSVDMRNFHVYQPPGGDNVLGVVKFRFPNKHDVYMHDTPTKRLFEASVRAFSHGCMRVNDPLKLAEVLLAQDKGWPASRVVAAVNSGRQDQQINLSHKFPVHITYFTASVGEDGKLKLFPDVYGHESRIALGIEGKAYLIPKVKEDKGPIRAEAIGALAESKANKKDEWIRRIFGQH